MKRQPADDFIKWVKKPRSAFFLDVLEIFALSSFAFAQPLFSLLQKNPNFFVARQSGPWDIILLAVGLCLIPPLLLSVLELLPSWISRRLQRGIHILLLTFLGGLILLPLLKSWGWLPRTRQMMLVFLITFIGAFLYHRWLARRGSLLFLLPAIVIFPLLFLLRPPVYKMVFEARQAPSEQGAPIGNPAPIVMIVFDEFPLTSLLNDQLEINPYRYPRFAAFAKESTWFRNATTVNESTLNAIPCILDGNYPRPNLALLPNATDHPRNLFTLLGQTYNFHVLENETQLCPESLCGKVAASPPRLRQIRALVSDLGVLYLYQILPTTFFHWLPDISFAWKDFAPPQPKARILSERMNSYADSGDYTGRPEDFRNFVNSIATSPKPTFHYFHPLLPHNPWQYFPSGRQYTQEMEIRGMRAPNDSKGAQDFWSENQWIKIHSYQRHLLQVSLVDSLLGCLIDHLKEIGLYDSALMVVTADHGYSFHSQTARRRLTTTNYADILAVPLFIKMPRQKEGKIDDRNVESVDILPTVADILKAPLPWHLDGRSLLQPDSPPRLNKSFVNDAGEWMTFGNTRDPLLASVKEKVGIFGNGAQPEEIFKVGKYGQLVEKNLAELNYTHQNSSRVQLDQGPFFDSVDLQSNFVPALIQGQIKPPRRDSSRPTYLAVALNGTVRAITESIWIEGREYFSALVPEWSFRNGANDVRVFLISDQQGNLSLDEFRKEGSPGEEKYGWSYRIRFGKSGNSGKFQAEGWSPPDGQCTWIDGKRGTLVLHIPRTKLALCLKAGVMGFVVPNRIGSQKIQIHVNRQLAGEWEIAQSDLQQKTLKIPNHLLKDQDTIAITFETPGAVSPSSLGVSPDVRELGLAMVWMELSPCTE